MAHQLFVVSESSLSCTCANSNSSLLSREEKPSNFHEGLEVVEEEAVQSDCRTSDLSGRQRMRPSTEPPDSSDVVVVTDVGSSGRKS